MQWPEILSGYGIILKPLQRQHYEALAVVAADPAIWTYLPTSGLGLQFATWFDKAMQDMAKGKRQAFAVYQAKDLQLLGTTSVYDISPEHRRAAIGYTWFVPAAWGSGVNRASKYFLFQCLFEMLNFNRIEFFIDARNQRSCGAVKKLGATEEGCLRQQRILDNGYIRDTMVYSLLQSEWPAVKNNLEEKLALKTDLSH